ncbi:chromosome-anchoring protein RacA [Halalkalibacter lacteus]|uniref:chromosome-anchoring protein RacA n=1 Tax=Halalkalibacter lacteus TaxID=3090663 RepID=UPI002FCC5A1F
MEMTMKTKEVSEQLGVNPTTVQRWAKYFGLVCETNEHGHYLFTPEHVLVMREVQEQLQQGKRMRDIQLTGLEPNLQPERKSETMIQSAVYEEKLEEVMNRVKELDQKLSQKADDVVSYQLLKHRTELDDMMKLIKSLEERLAKMESKVHSQHLGAEENELPLVVGGNVKSRKWRSFMQIFSF